jgi:hypothetical protein
LSPFAFRFDFEQHTGTSHDTIIKYVPMTLITTALPADRRESVRGLRCPLRSDPAVRC